MKNFIVLLILAGLGYLAYENWPAIEQRARPYIPGASASSTSSAISGPYSVRVLDRHSPGGPLDAMVILTNGNRWRVEAMNRVTRRVLVIICDGAQTVWNRPGSEPPPGAASLDPRPSYELLLNGAARMYKAQLSTSQRVLVQADGHACMKGTVEINGSTYQIWIDAATGFPVCAVMTKAGFYLEIHLSQIPIDFTQPGTGEFFNTTHLAPFFTSYLNL
jgi:hypothetical protein